MFALPQSIPHLSASVLDSFLSINLSQASLLFTDQTIDLHGLDIASIESNTFISYPSSVSTLILSFNRLTHLPRTLFKPFASTLTHLNLQHNRLPCPTSPLSFRCLRQLRTLDLSRNQWKEIHHRDFRGLRQLDTLILRENQLTHLSHASFRHCSTIQTLDLSENKIALIHPHAFRRLHRLRILLLNNNPLAKPSLNVELMKPLNNLRYLDLENTQLDDLPPFLFAANPRLRSLKLRRNNFRTRVNDSKARLKRTFCGARSLNEIDLISSQIRSLDTCTYSQLSSLRRLYLMNNPLHCTCDLLYLKYGDIYRVLLVDGNGIDQSHTNIDKYLNRWITRPELRRHLERAYARGDFTRLPVELSLFARCATPNRWSGHEVDNITQVYGQCQHRWTDIEQECQNYCQSDDHHNMTIVPVVASDAFALTGHHFCFSVFFIVANFQRD